MPGPLALFALLLFAAPATTPTAEPLRVGDAIAPPGAKASGWIDVPDGADPGTRIPVSVVHGAQPGPVLALVAGTHGYEYTSIIALPRLLPRLDPARMSGLGDPRAHGQPAGVLRPADLLRSGRQEPQPRVPRPRGRDGERAHRPRASPREVIDKATHLADMHCGDGNESLRPYTYWQVSGNAAIDEASRQLALAFGLDHIVVDRERPQRPGAAACTPPTPRSCAASPPSPRSRAAWGSPTRRRWARRSAGALSLVAHLGIMDAPSVAGGQSGLDRPQRGAARHRHRACGGRRWRRCSRWPKGTLLGRDPPTPSGPSCTEVRAPFARRDALRRRHAARHRRRAAGLRGPDRGGRPQAVAVTERPPAGRRPPRSALARTPRRRWRPPTTAWPAGSP